MALESAKSSYMSEKSLLVKTDTADFQVDTETGYIVPRPLTLNKVAVGKKRRILPKPLTKMQIFKSKIWRHFRNVLPFFMLMIYTILGGVAFWLAEGSGGIVKNETTTVEEARRKSAESIADFVNSRNDNFIITSKDLEPYLQTFSNKLGSQPKKRIELDYLASVFYAGTLYTTIGYGSIYPRTLGGKILTIIYALIGIPLLLYTLSELGKLFCFTIWKLYAKFNIYMANWFGKYWRKKDDPQLAEFPFSVAVLLTFGYLLSCSALFCLWEDWNFFTSFYFFFQSLTTIGLGDVTPKHTHYMVYSFLLIIIGLALVSMCWNLVQIKLDSLVQRTMKEMQESLIHLEGDDDLELPTEEKAKQAVDKIMAAENNWLGSLLSENRKQTLMTEWQHRAMHRNRRVQTDHLVANKAVQEAPESADVSLQTGDIKVIKSKGGDMDLVPYREIPARMAHSSSDECRGMLKELSFIINDCRDIMKTSIHSTPEHTI